MIRHFDRHGGGNQVAVETFAWVMAARVLLVGLDSVLHIFGFQATSIFAAGTVFVPGAGSAVKSTVERPR
jgi:hypothetical protein